MSHCLGQEGPRGHEFGGRRVRKAMLELSLSLSLNPPEEELGRSNRVGHKC